MSEHEAEGGAKVQVQDLCEKLSDENEELRDEVLYLQRHIEEMSDRFHEDELDYCRRLQRELEASAKASRVLEFKLYRTQRRLEEVEKERNAIADQLKLMQKQPSNQGREGHEDEQTRRIELVQLTTCGLAGSTQAEAEVEVEATLDAAVAGASQVKTPEAQGRFTKSADLKTVQAPAYEAALQELTILKRRVVALQLERDALASELPNTNTRTNKQNEDGNQSEAAPDPDCDQSTLNKHEESEYECASPIWVRNLADLTSSVRCEENRSNDKLRTAQADNVRLQEENNQLILLLARKGMCGVDAVECMRYLMLENQQLRARLKSFDGKLQVLAKQVAAFLRADAVSSDVGSCACPRADQSTCACELPKYEYVNNLQKQLAETETKLHETLQRVCQVEEENRRLERDCQKERGLVATTREQRSKREDLAGATREELLDEVCDLESKVSDLLELVRRGDQRLVRLETHLRSCRDDFHERRLQSDNRERRLLAYVRNLLLIHDQYCTLTHIAMQRHEVQLSDLDCLDKTSANAADVTQTMQKQLQEANSHNRLLTKQVEVHKRAILNAIGLPNSEHSADCALVHEMEKARSELEEKRYLVGELKREVLALKQRLERSRRQEQECVPEEENEQKTTVLAEDLDPEHTVCELTAQNHMLRATLQERDNYLRLQEALITELNKQYNEIASDFSKVNQRCESTDVELMQLQDKLSLLQKRHDELAELKQQLQRQLVSSDAQMRLAMDELQRADAKCAQLHACKAELEDSLRHRTAAHETLSRELKACEERLAKAAASENNSAKSGKSEADCCCCHSLAVGAAPRQVAKDESVTPICDYKVQLDAISKQLAGYMKEFKEMNDNFYKTPPHWYPDREKLQLDETEDVEWRGMVVQLREVLQRTALKLVDEEKRSAALEIRCSELADQADLAGSRSSTEKVNVEDAQLSSLRLFSTSERSLWQSATTGIKNSASCDQLSSEQRKHSLWLLEEKNRLLVEDRNRMVQDIVDRHRQELIALHSVSMKLEFENHSLRQMLAMTDSQKSLDCSKESEDQYSRQLKCNLNEETREPQAGAGAGAGAGVGGLSMSSGCSCECASKAAVPIITNIQNTANELQQVNSLAETDTCSLEACRKLRKSVKRIAETVAASCAQLEGTLGASTKPALVAGSFVAALPRSFTVPARLQSDCVTQSMAQHAVTDCSPSPSPSPCVRSYSATALVGTHTAKTSRASLTHVEPNRPMQVRKITNYPDPPAGFVIMPTSTKHSYTSLQKLEPLTCDSAQTTHTGGLRVGLILSKIESLKAETATQPQTAPPAPASCSKLQKGAIGTLFSKSSVETRQSFVSNTNGTCTPRKVHESPKRAESANGNGCRWTVRQVGQGKPVLKLMHSKSLQHGTSPIHSPVEPSPSVAGAQSLDAPKKFVKFDVHAAQSASVPTQPDCEQHSPAGNLQTAAFTKTSGASKIPSAMMANSTIGAVSSTFGVTNSNETVKAAASLGRCSGAGVRPNPNPNPNPNPSLSLSLSLSSAPPKH